MPDSMSCRRTTGGYCQRCDVLVGLPGLHVVSVDRGEAGLRIEVETSPDEVMGCPACGVVTHRHGRQQVELIDAPCFAVAVTLVWRKRRWLCPEPTCEVVSFMEQDPPVAAPRALLTRRAVEWAIGQLRRENASIHRAWPANSAARGERYGEQYNPCWKRPPRTRPSSPASPSWGSTRTSDPTLKYEGPDTG